MTVTTAQVVAQLAEPADPLTAAAVTGSLCIACKGPLYRGRWSLVDTGERRVPCCTDCLYDRGHHPEGGPRQRVASVTALVADARRHTPRGLRERAAAAEARIDALWLAGAGKGGTLLERRAAVAATKVHG